MDWMLSLRTEDLGQSGKELEEVDMVVNSK